MDDLELLLSLQSEDNSDPLASGDVIREQSSNAAVAESAASFSRIAALSEPSLGYCSDEDRDKSRPLPNMSVFKDALKSSSSLCESTENIVNLNLANKTPIHPLYKGASCADGADLEAHSGLRIKNRILSAAVLTSKLVDLRFVRLQALKNAMMGDVVKGAWATVCVVAEKGSPRVSSNDSNYAIWKLSTLDTTVVSLFLFGDAYREHWKESVGSVVVIFNAKVRRDDKRNEFSVSISNVNQLTVVGTSMDYGICTGKRKDGTPCSVPVNRREGVFCKFHLSAPRTKHRSIRPELAGGNLSIGLVGSRMNRGFQPVKQAAQTSPEPRPFKRTRHRSSAELSKLLSDPDKLTTRTSSQGLRFLASVGNNFENKQVVKPANKKQKPEPDHKPARPPLKEVSNSSHEAPKKVKVIELEFEAEDGPDAAMVQALSIFKSTTNS